LLFPLLVISRRRQSLILGLLTTGAPLTIWYWLVYGINPFEILMAQSGAMTPPSVITLFSWNSAFINYINTYPIVPRALIGIGVTSIVLLLLPHRSEHPRFIFTVVALCWLAFLLLSPKSLTSYRISILIALPWLLRLFHNTPVQDLVWTAYNSALSIQYMWYEDYIRGHYFPYVKFVAFMKTSGSLDWRVLIGLILDFIIVASEVFIFWLLFTMAKSHLLYESPEP